MWWFCNVSVWLGQTTFLRIPFLVCFWLRWATREILERFGSHLVAPPYFFWAADSPCWCKTQLDLDPVSFSEFWAGCVCLAPWKRAWLLQDDLITKARSNTNGLRHESVLVGSQLVPVNLSLLLPGTEFDANRSWFQKNRIRNMSALYVYNLMCTDLLPHYRTWKSTDNPEIMILRNIPSLAALVESCCFLNIIWLFSLRVLSGTLIFSLGLLISGINYMPLLEFLPKKMYFSFTKDCHFML